MFWDRVSSFYDFFETAYNGKVYKSLGKAIAQEINSEDTVLECACGTGAISRYIAPRCRLLVATDFSVGMLKQAKKNCSNFHNVIVKRADMTRMNCRDDRFDKVIAGNVIHLLSTPYAAVKELERVCKPGGKIIIPTYINASDKTNKAAVRLLELMGADFKRQFDMDSYRSFFEKAGYKDVEMYVIDGKMPCAVAIITKTKPVVKQIDTVPAVEEEVIMTPENDLIQNLDKLHTTALGALRITKNLSLADVDPVQWCKDFIASPTAEITRQGKNFYITDQSCTITVNAHSYTIITAHKNK